MTAPKVHCPNCGGTKFQIVVQMNADFVFDEEGDHEIQDQPYGDVEFDEHSNAICTCGWSGQVKDLV